MAAFECSVRGEDGNVRVVPVDAADAVSAAALASEGGRVLSVMAMELQSAFPTAPLEVPPECLDPTVKLPDPPEPLGFADPTCELPQTPWLPLPTRLPVLELRPPKSESVPTPNPAVYAVGGVIKEDRLRTLSLVVETTTGRALVAHQLHAPGNLSEAEAERRFGAGAEMLRGRTHPRMPACLGYQHTPTGHWLLFEYVEGYPLGLYQGECQNVPDEWVVWWLHQMLLILEAVHASGATIGSLHPRHFLVAGTDLYLVHVGVMETLFPEATALNRAPERLAFTAPEHHHSTLTSVAGDLWSVGAIAWWVAVGSPPPLAPRLNPVTAETVVRQARPGLSPPAVSVLVRLLSFQAGERFPTATEACQALAPSLPVLDELQSPPAPAKFRWFGVDPLRHPSQQAADLPPLEVQTVRRSGLSMKTGQWKTVSMTTDKMRPSPLLQQEERPHPGAPPARSSRTLAGALLGVLLLGLAASGWRMVRHPAILALQAGTAFRDGGSEPASEFGDGDRITVGSGGARLKCHAATLWLDAGAAIRCGGQRDNRLSLTVDGGALRVLTGAADSVVLHLQSTDVVLDPASDVKITGQGLATCKAGTASVGTRKLKTGESSKLF